MEALMSLLTAYKCKVIIRHFPALNSCYTFRHFVHPTMLVDTIL
jgi:hypothetical protein